MASYGNEADDTHIMMHERELELMRAVEHEIDPDSDFEFIITPPAWLGGHFRFGEPRWRWRLKEIYWKAVVYGVRPFLRWIGIASYMPGPWCTVAEWEARRGGE